MKPRYLTEYMLQRYCVVYIGIVRRCSGWNSSLDSDTYNSEQ